MTSNPEVKRTRATLRRAEFGFFGVVVYTRVQTPRRWGQLFSAGDLVFLLALPLSSRMSCWIVGIVVAFYFLANPKFSTVFDDSTDGWGFESRILKPAVNCPFLGVIDGNCKGNPTITGFHGLRIGELKSPTHQILGIVDRQSLHIDPTLGIN